MTGIDTPQIVYDGEYECSTGQSITFDYCCCAARFTNANARVLLEVQRPDGTIKVLDAAGITTYLLATDLDGDGTDESYYNVPYCTGTCTYKFDMGGRYVFQCKFIASAYTLGDADILSYVQAEVDTAVSNGVGIGINVGLPLIITVTDGATYVDKYSVAVTHKITTTAAYADTLQWQEETEGTWADIEGATAEEYVIGTWTGEPADDEETARANTNAIIPAYDRRFRCVATNEVGSTVSAVQHVTHTEGNGTPTITEE